MPADDDKRDLDRAIHAAEARLTGGISPASLGLAFADWLIHLAGQPGRQLSLFQQAAHDAAALTRLALSLPAETLAPAPGDHRFAAPGWQHGPSAFAAQAFLRAERFWNSATTNVHGVSRENERMVNFVARQALDMLAPSNYPALNPEVLTRVQETSGDNLREGARHFIEDLRSLGSTTAQPLPMRPGRDVALTPGAVVFRNDLIELLQYSPTTETVRPEPILIVPAWIMKYYILDLSPHNSMVKYLVGQGHTVFAISWRNPDETMRDVTLEDYRLQGVMAALDAITAICGAPKIHAVGYCLGGTLLTIAASAMARDHDERLTSITLLAAQTDFTEAGELQLFINESQLAFLEDAMWAQGYLDTSQMAGAFQMLRANDLIWSNLIRRYYLGEETHPNDMMSWNQDATRMPYMMHAQYLRGMFLNNDLAEGRLEASGHKVSVADIHVPLFVIGTETDHIAPWRSVYKIMQINPGDITFVLTSGGHNAGVVSEPGHKGRHFCHSHHQPGELHVPAEEWHAHAQCQEGSWWPLWAAWLGGHSGPPAPPPPLGAPAAGYPAMEPAPGQYVLQR